MNDKKIKMYNRLIKMSAEIIATWKKGSYEFKAKEIESCKRDIAFFKAMKSKLV